MTTDENINAIRDIMENQKALLWYKSWMYYSIEDSEERFENVEAKKPSVPDLGAQILVEISRWLLDQPTEFAIKFDQGLGQ